MKTVQVMMMMMMTNPFALMVLTATGRTVVSCMHTVLLYYFGTATSLSLVLSASGCIVIGKTPPTGENTDTLDHLHQVSNQY